MSTIISFIFIFIIFVVLFNPYVALVVIGLLVIGSIWDVVMSHREKEVSDQVAIDIMAKVRESR